MAEALASIFLEVVVAPAFDAEALEILAAKPNLRVLVDERLADDDPPPPTAAAPTGRSARAGGAVLVTAPDVVADDPPTWTCVTRRAPTDEELRRPRPRLAAGPRGDVERDRAGHGPSAGRHRQRPDVAGRCRPAGRRQGPRDARAGRRRRAPPARSDAFFPFPDALEACLAAGVTAVRPAGRLDRDDRRRSPSSTRPAATMLMTGTRHFRH